MQSKVTLTLTVQKIDLELPFLNLLCCKFSAENGSSAQGRTIKVIFGPNALMSLYTYLLYSHQNRAEQFNESIPLFQASPPPDSCVDKMMGYPFLSATLFS